MDGVVVPVAVGEGMRDVEGVSLLVTVTVTVALADIVTVAVAEVESVALAVTLAVLGTLEVTLVELPALEVAATDADLDLLGDVDAVGARVDRRDADGARDGVRFLRCCCLLSRRLPRRSLLRRSLLSRLSRCSLRLLSFPRELPPPELPPLEKPPPEDGLSRFASAKRAEAAPSSAPFGSSLFKTKSNSCSKRCCSMLRSSAADGAGPKSRTDDVERSAFVCTTELVSIKRTQRQMARSAGAARKRCRILPAAKTKIASSKD